MTIEMLKISQNKMFTALKYHSTDYLYESMARQKFSIWKLSLCFPPCLHQDEKYHLNGLFADDKYRKPWTRIGSTQNTIAISGLDQWKKSLPVEDFLEKKPISSVEFQTTNDLIEVIPSSDPHSQTYTEEPFLLTKNGFKEDSTQDKYLKIYYGTEFKEPQQDLYLEEEFVFIDNLEHFRKKLPTLSILLSRLQFFFVKDPLLDSEGQFLTAENVFRECLTFQNGMKVEESQNELQWIKESFCTVSMKDEEYFLLPVDLEFDRSDSVKIPSYLQLKEVLNLAPVPVDDEDLCKQVIGEDLKAEIIYNIEISKYCAIPQEVCSSISTSMLEFCESEPSREFLESLVWQSEKYRDNMSSLLLVEHPSVNLAHQHHSLTELQKKLALEVEAPVLGSLEDGWWLHRGLNPPAVEILEQFNMDGSNANSLLPTEVETFTQFTSYQLERWLEEKNSVTNQELLSAERHQSEKVVNRDLSLQIQSQNFATSAPPSAKLHSTNTSVEELSGGSISKMKTEEAICFLNQEKKTPKPSELDSSTDVSSKLDNSSCSGKPASLALASKWANDDSDLNSFIMMRSKYTVTQREEKYYVDRPEKESQCQAYCLLEEAAIPVLKDLTHLGVLASVTWSFDSVKFDHTRFFLKQQEKVICDHFKQSQIDEKEIMLFRHAALVHLLVTVRDLLLTCGLDTALGYLSKAKDVYKNILESCLNNIWRQLKIVQYSSQKKHEAHPKITALQCEVLNWMKSCGENHSVKILIITRIDSEREKAAFIHPLSKIEGLKAVDLNSEKKQSPLSCKEIISKYGITFVERSSGYSLRLFGSTDRYVVLTIDECTAIFLQVVLTPGIEETVLVIRQIADNILIASNISPHEWLDKSWLSVLPSEHFSDISSYSLNTAALEKTVKGASHPENQNNFNTLYLDNKQHCQILELLDQAQNSTGTSHMNSEALIPPLNHCKGFLKSDLPSCMKKKACSSDIITRRKLDYEDFAHLEVKSSLHVQRQPFRMHDSSDHSSKDSEKEDFFATFSDCEPQERSKSFLDEFRDTTFKSPEIQIDQPLWNDSSSTGPRNSFAHDGFLSDFFGDMDELQNLNFNQIGETSKGKRKQRSPFLQTKEKIKTDSGFPEVQEFKKRRLIYERVPGRRDGQTRLKFF
ncbi:hypothetical protein DV515_00012188 [Chloebia gouldiae]|uniref:Shortage in chiasmata 1 n=1 Tax=Chloebia gouldiae TaxID=44316 RepID=A0A3L8S4W4_CHLGU|nr:hypothetical protein DV515_00012188 [Chloebia gouldiae]